MMGGRAVWSESVWSNCLVLLVVQPGKKQKCVYTHQYTCGRRCDATRCDSHRRIADCYFFLRCIEKKLCWGVGIVYQFLRVRVRITSLRLSSFLPKGVHLMIIFVSRFPLYMKLLVLPSFSHDIHFRGGSIILTVLIRPKSWATRTDRHILIQCSRYLYLCVLAGEIGRHCEK